jgi:hypothetical protein
MNFIYNIDVDIFLNYIKLILLVILKEMTINILYMQRIELVVPTGYDATEIKITLKPGKIPVKVVERVPESDALHGEKL